MFPMALNMLPLSNIWAIIFFLMMICLGVDTMFSFLEFVCAVVEEYLHGKKETIRFIIVLVYSVIGIIFCFGNGF
jgi:SNF family Na+-dependent transporter